MTWLKPKESLFGFEVLQEDLMASSSQLAVYLGVNRSALSHLNSGRNKPSGKVLVGLASLANAINPLAVNPSILAETTEFKIQLEEELISSLRLRASKLNYLLETAKRDLSTAIVKYEHSMTAVNNLHYTLAHIKNATKTQKNWLERHIQFCQEIARSNGPLNQTNLKLKIKSMEVELAELQRLIEKDS